MEPSIFACFQNARDCPIERVTVICRYAATTNSEEYVNDGTHASPSQRKRLQWYFSTIQSSTDSRARAHVAPFREPRGADVRYLRPLAGKSAELLRGRDTSLLELRH